MAKAELKTKVNDASVDDFIHAQPESVASDCRAIMAMMRKATGEEPRMWGASIVGYGRYRYKGASGREGEWMLTGFSPRKAALSVYILSGLDQFAELLAKLGKHSTGKGCLYIKRLSDVDPKVLERLIVSGVKAMAKLRVK
ncbi:MAG: DUF1801 domain-containing protein [Flavobacteriales bacterium]|nr:DUF1801 domain-containing protein [Flavobacteriales bacterium]